MCFLPLLSLKIAYFTSGLRNSSHHPLSREKQTSHTAAAGTQAPQSSWVVLPSHCREYAPAFRRYHLVAPLLGVFWASFLRVEVEAGTAARVAMGICILFPIQYNGVHPKRRIHQLGFGGESMRSTFPCRKHRLFMDSNSPFQGGEIGRLAHLAFENMQPVVAV